LLKNNIATTIPNEFRKMKKVILPLIFLVLNAVCIGQSNIKIGEKAPKINVSHWVHNKPINTEFENKFIVLEFWATWCGPCIAAVPHMNILQAEINNPDLLFVSITDEPEAKIKRILEKVDFKSIVVTDTTKKTQINFGDGRKGLEAYPMTVLIDNKGWVKWIGEPNQLSVEILEKFVIGNLVGKNHFANKATQQGGVESVKQINTAQTTFWSVLKNKEKQFYFDLQQSEIGENINIKFGNTAVLITDVSIADIYKEVLGVKIRSNDSIKYTLIYKNKRDTSAGFSTLENLLLDKLGLTRKQSRVKETKYLIEIKDKAMLKPTLSDLISSKSEAGDKILFNNYSIAVMIEAMSEILNLKCEYDGTNDQKYDFVIESKNLSSFQESLLSYGLSVRETSTEEEFIFLENKDWK
jgi:thiol-disulfide isomerase/thioredoxin